ncbi:MAG: TraB/GumN family protein [Saprospiraceae bacterium]|nr:TraB/GumN family protein [Saprospiraceae bacterium]
MYRFFTLLLVISISAIHPLWGQKDTPISYAPTDADKSLLWEISGSDLSAPSFLYGTIHMIDKADFFLTESTKTALSNTEKITFEINMEDMNNFAALMPVMMKMFMADGKTLKDLYTEEEYELVKGHFEKLGLPLAFLGRIKPMFLSMMASEDAMSMQNSTQTGEIVSYEMELMKMAQEQEKAVDGLETAEFQMSLFDSIPYDVQAQMLMATIESDDTTSESSQLEEMVEMYKNQDIQAMQRMVKGDEGGISEYEELLLLRRNRNWIPVMQDMMASNPTFFAVGAGHLGGEEGVIALLRKAGYTVRPIPK